MYLVTLAPEKVQKVLDFPLPKTVREMRSFIGLVNYIDNCSTHLKPYQQMVTEATKLYGNKKSKSNNKPVQWNQEREAAFQKVQQLANECPTLFFLTEAENRCIGLWDWRIFVSERRGWLRTTFLVHE
jgi:hypothetical protein